MLGTSGYDRIERDFYPTPRTATEAIFETVDWFGTPTLQAVWEPACGDGAMSNVLAEHFSKVISTDIHPMMEGATKADFYTYEPDELFTWIITNPPYGDEIDKFMERVQFWVKKGVHCSLLARNELDSAKCRAKFFRDCPNFLEKRVLLWRPRWVADSTGSPRHNYSWYTWGPNWDNNPPRLTYSFEKK
jgi:hypothetical protein